MRDDLKYIINSKDRYISTGLKIEKKMKIGLTLYIISLLLFLGVLVIKGVIGDTSVLLSLFGSIATIFLAHITYRKLKIQKRLNTYFLSIKEKLENEEEINLNEFKKYEEIAKQYYKGE